LGLSVGLLGEELEGRMLNQWVACEFVRIPNQTRTNSIVTDITRGTQTVFSSSGPGIEPYELMQMIHKVEKFQEPDMVILNGSVPPGVQPEIYRSGSQRDSSGRRERAVSGVASQDESRKYDWC
jgi:fructose-1-phosphate kinase PfkB-like protein